MFRIGDKVICINNTNCERFLTMNKVYVVVFTNVDKFNIINDENMNLSLVSKFGRDRFISLQEYRKLKYRKLKICITQNESKW